MNQEPDEKTAHENIAHDERAPDLTDQASTGRAGLRSLIELTRVRLLEPLREPEVIFWAFIFPVLLTVTLGLAFQQSAPEKLRVGVVNAPHAPETSAKKIVAALSGSPLVEAQLLSPDEATRSLRGGHIALAIWPEQAENRTAPVAAETKDSDAPRAVQYAYDPTRQDGRMARIVVDDVLQRGLGRPDVLSAGDRIVTEPGGRYIDFLIPGLIGMNLMVGGISSLGYLIVQARLRRLLKRFAVTPMRRTHYLLSFIFSRLAFLSVQVTLVLSFARVVFGVKVRGAWFDVIVILLIGAAAFAGIGLLIASRLRTMEGASGLINLAIMSMSILCGTFFASTRFPAALQPLIRVLPLTALNDSLRAVMNDGAPLLANWPQLCLLLGWGGICFLLALRIFRWQ